MRGRRSAPQQLSLQAPNVPLTNKVDLWPAPLVSTNLRHPYADQSSVAGKLSDFVDRLAGDHRPVWVTPSIFSLVEQGFAAIFFNANAGKFVSLRRGPSGGLISRGFNECPYGRTRRHPPH
ncbi:hypothetical protein SAMN06265173_12064 [Thalassovita litoralis]|uniref:Uncharacterized protein n=1 Tax=Thalassovita litoralis TaxID=1010611 RepID=A0A521EX78_9RHOB|nr:hypothetical protein SAMN06265173_12064 [Thalassovita litoralis]